MNHRKLSGRPRDTGGKRGTLEAGDLQADREAKQDGQTEKDLVSRRGEFLTTHAW